MVNQELKNYIAECRKGGIPDETIRSELLKNGWESAAISEALIVVVPPINKPAPQPLAPVLQPQRPIAVAETPPSVVISQSPTKTFDARKLLIGIAALLVIVIVGALAASFIFFKPTPPEQVPASNTPSQDTNVNSTIQNEREVSAFGSEAALDTRPVTSITYISDEGATTTESCGSRGCFEKNFASCSPSTLEADAGLLGRVKYEILSKGVSGCNLSFDYIRAPNEDWTGTEMSCEFNNKLSFITAGEAVFRGVTDGTVICTGTLYDILSTINKN